MTRIQEENMFQTLRKWLGRNSLSEIPAGRIVEWKPKSAIPVSPRSRPFPNDPWPLGGSKLDSLPPPGVDPRLLFPLLRRLRDYIPDVSAGVWAWVRLCSTPLTYTFEEGSAADRERARGILQHLNRRVYGLQNERERGIDSLVQAFFLSVFTYGAFCGELVLDDRRERIDRFIPIDPATIRFRMNPQTREYRPYQIQADGALVKLNPSSFFYYGLDTDGLSPYGRPPLLALPLVVRLQQQLLRDMARAQHNAGYPSIHLRVAMPERHNREKQSEYHQRIQHELEQMRDELERKDTDSNIITFDNVEIQYVGPNGNAHQWSESIQAIGEQVISALHLAPFMIGRNWGTTQSWGTAQYQLLTNNARTVQEGAKRLVEWLCNLELLLAGISMKAVHRFAPHHHLDAFDRARAFRTAAETLIALSDKGFIETESTRQRIETLIRFL